MLLPNLFKKHGCFNIGFSPFKANYFTKAKAFVLNFTEGLWAEARGTGLRVLAVCPGPMDTEFFDAAGSQSADLGAKRLTPRAVVAQALATLDRRSAPPSVITNGRSLTLLSRLLSRRQVAQIMGRLTRRAHPQPSVAPTSS